MRCIGEVGMALRKIYKKKKCLQQALLSSLYKALSIKAMIPLYQARTRAFPSTFPALWITTLIRLYTSAVIMDTTTPFTILNGPTQIIANVHTLLIAGCRRPCLDDRI